MQRLVRALAFGTASCASIVPSPGAAQAADDAWGVYLQVGHSGRDGNGRSLAVGVVAPWFSGRALWNGKVSAYWDLSVGEWRGATPAGGTTSYTQLGVVPMFRYRWDGGSSAWFADAGIGLNYVDGLYYQPSTAFSTRLNFADTLAIGRSFGSQGQHEVALRWQHFSNAGIKKPNPGENFLQLRYTAKF